MKRTPLPPRNTPLVARTRLVSTTGLAPGGPWSRPVPSLSAKTAATRSTPTTSGRAESFPPLVAALIDIRDRWCVKCGSPSDLHRHHRRIKGIGGDSRPHTDCACNGILLCLGHHEWAHSGKGRREAEAEGLIIPRSETAPWRHPLMVHTAAGSGFTGWPACDGRYLYEAPEGAVALCPG